MFPVRMQTSTRGEARREPRLLPRLDVAVCAGTWPDRLR